MEGVPSRQFQIWLWQVLPPDPPAYAELRWHPDAGEQVAFVHLQAHRRTHLAEVKVLSRLLTISLQHNRQGRPPGPTAFQSLPEFELTLRQTLAWLEKTYPTVPKWRIANAVHRLAKQPRAQRQHPQRTLRKIDDDRELEAARKYLQRCADHFKVNIDTLMQQIWHDLHET